MWHHPGITTLRAEPQIINLEPGDAVVCLEGSIWATSTGGHGLRPPTDEVLSAGDSLVSSQHRTYCISTLQRRASTFTIVRSSAQQLSCLRKHPRANVQGYLLVSGDISICEGVQS